MRKTIKIRKVVLIMIIAISMLPILLLGSISMVYTRLKSNENYKTNAEFLLSQALSLIENMVDDNMKLMEAAVKNGDLTDLDSFRQDLQMLTAHDDTVYSVYYGDGITGTLLFPDEIELPEGYDVRDSGWYSEIREGNLDELYDPVYEDELGEPGVYVITFYKAVRQDGELLGVIAIDIQLSKLAEELSALKYLNTGKLIVTETNGTVIASGDEALIGTTEPTEYEIWDEVSNNESGELEYTYNSTQYKGYYATSSKLGWKLIFRTENSELVADEIREFMIIIAISVGIIVVAFIISLIVSKKTSEILEILNDKLDKSSRGDFKEALIFNSNFEELVYVENGFNKMRDTLGPIMKNVTLSAESVDETVVESTKTSKEILSAIEQVTNTMQEMSNGTTYAAHGVEDIANEMVSLSNAMNKIQEATQNVNKMAEDANLLSDRGIKVVDSVIKTSSETKNSTESVRDVVKQVSESIAKIEDINKTISNITEQTNLLSLNAAIEAARAGEAGRGFAVVSDQIRKLAEETAVSANEIDSILKEINKKSNLAVERVNETSNVVNYQEKAVLESKDIFNEIISSFEVLGKKVGNISVNISDVNNMKDKVVQQVENLSALLEETAAGSEEITTSVVEISNATEKFTNEFDNLGEKSTLLKDQVEKFKF